jgi:hypothetical protein
MNVPRRKKCRVAEFWLLPRLGVPGDAAGAGLYVDTRLQLG